MMPGVASVAVSEYLPGLTITSAPAVALCTASVILQGFTALQSIPVPPGLA